MQSILRATIMPMPKKSQRISRYGEKDVWAIFSPLSLIHKSINLGQGFPNFPAPNFVIQSGIDALNKNMNQYSPTRGLPHLLKTLSSYYSPIFHKTLDPNSEIMISQGANQGILAILQAHLDPGDEVLLIEPYFDIYKYHIEMTGGKIVSVPLRLKSFDSNISANAFYLDYDEMKRAITPKTRILILNTPHNPTGKVFSKNELDMISNIANEHNLLVISDEVYDKLCFEIDHIPIATLPNMWARTITVGSAGKTFGVTGWRVGWLIGHEDLIKNAVSAQARTVFCTSTPLQEAVALAFERAQECGYFDQLKQEYIKRRDILLECFHDLGLPAAKTQGSFFILANFERLLSNPDFIKEAQLDKQQKSEEEPDHMETLDYSLCRYLTTSAVGVTAIPPSAFYSRPNKHLSSNWVRFCFAKDESTLLQARSRLLYLKKWLN